MADSSSPPAAKRAKTADQTTLTNFFQVNTAPGTSDKSSSEEKNLENESANTAIAVAVAKTDDLSNADDPQDCHEAIIPTPVSPASNSSWNTYRGACIYRKVSNEPPRTRVAAFDLDGTLLEWRTSGWPSRMEHYELWNAEVVTKMRQLHDDGYKLVIFSNQGAIRGALTGKKATHVKSLLDWVAYTVGRPLHVVMSTNKKDDNNFHKPSPNMWHVAQEVCNRGQEFDIKTSFYVGDSVGQEGDDQGGVDIQFAKNVGLKFFTPDKYFGPSHKQLREKMQSMGDYEEPSEQILQTRAALISGYLTGPILLILCGIQGSGKSTFCEHLLKDNADRWVHLSQDTINGGRKGTREKVEEAARMALKNSKSVVIDRMHLDETQRAHFLDIAKEVGVPSHVVALLPPKEVIVKRVLERENHPGGVQGEKGVKIAAKSKLEMPTYSEGFALVSASGTVEGAAKIVESYRSVRFSMEPKCGSPMPTRVQLLSSLPLLTRVSSECRELCTASISIPASFHLGENVALPSITLGTAKLGRKVAKDVVASALGMGFEAVDTAPTYKNEEKVGEAIDDDTFCIVKVPKCAASPGKVLEELEKSLSNLKRKHADLLLLHWPSDVIATGTIKEVWQTMEKLQKDGRALAIGVCNFNVPALRILLPHCTIPPAVNQVERHPLLPQFELVDFCARNDILLQAHSPLGQGSTELLDHAVVKQIAESTGQTSAQVILEWNLQSGVAAAVKCSSNEHMREILAVRFSDGLSGEHMKSLNELSEKKRFVDPPFMYGSASYCWGKQRPTN